MLPTMPRRATPPPEAVEPVLAPIRKKRAQIRRAEGRLAELREEHRTLVRAAAEHEPRPTNQQIADADGVDRTAIDQVLRATP